MRAITPMLAVLCLSLAACAQTPRHGSAHVPPETNPTMPAPADLPSESSTPPATESDAPTCDASAAQSFLGKPADKAVVTDVKAAAGATGAVRVIKPGQAVTMDFRADRLNVTVDAKNIIVGITCG